MIRFSWFYLPLGLYLAAMAVSTVASENLRLSVVKLAGEAYLIGLAVLSFNLIRSETLMRRTMKAWLAGTVITVLVSVIGVIAFYAGVRNPDVNFAITGYGSLPPGNYTRVQGLFDNPNVLCNFLSVSLMIALVMRSLGRLKEFWFRLFIVLLWVSAVFTFSLGLGGMLLSSGLWIWARLRNTERRHQGQMALAGGFAMALVFILATIISPTPAGQRAFFTLPGTHIRIEPSLRVRIWQTALETFKEHPLLGRGVGLGVAGVAYTSPSGTRHYFTDAHNVWLSIAGQEGVTGLLAFSSIIFFLMKGLRPLRATGSTQAVIRAGLAIAFIGAFLYQSLAGSFEDTRHLWVLIGMLAAAKDGLEEVPNEI